MIKTKIFSNIGFTLFILCVIFNSYGSNSLSDKSKHLDNQLMLNEIVSDGYQITVCVKNQYKKYLAIHKIKGSRSFPLDSISYSATQVGIENSSGKNYKYRIDIPAKFQVGIYRLVFGKTLAAELLNEPPQYIDIVFNKEDIVLETDFKAPFDSLKVRKSVENSVWFDYNEGATNLNERLEFAKLELEYCNSHNSIKTKCKEYVERYNKVQQERNEFILDLVKDNSSTYVSKIIRNYIEPFIDGNLSKEERELILVENYLKNVDFSDTTLINSSVFTDKVYQYLMVFARSGISKKEQEREFIKAVDKIFSSITQSSFLQGKESEVFDFVLEYLLNGFEETNMESIIAYIGDNYSNSVCNSDKKTILERKISFHKMKSGTTAPNFNIPDINKDFITLSEILKPYNLIIFWSSTCPHCSKLLPKIKDWYKSIDSHKVEVITVSLDDVHIEWEQKVFELGIEAWYNCSDLKSWDGQTALDYNIYATPTMFIIDDHQKILAKPKTIKELIAFFNFL